MSQGTNAYIVAMTKYADVVSDLSIMNDKVTELFKVHEVVATGYEILLDRVRVVATNLETGVSREDCAAQLRALLGDE